MRDPIYKPKDAALEYADYALNIYTGCPHECWYCYVPLVLRISKEKFYSDVRPRDGIVEAVKKQLDKGNIKGELIHLCLTCDPFPIWDGYITTFEIMNLIKDSGNNVQILTQNSSAYDPVHFSCLNGDDWFGVTIEGKYASYRLKALEKAITHGIKTWVSFEPVLDPVWVLKIIRERYALFDRIVIGKLNHHESYIDWKKFGIEAERLCQDLGINYRIKGSLRKEMEK